MLEGIAAGFIYSLTLFPGTVWLVKVGVRGRQAQVLAVGSAFWLAQLIWFCIALPGLMIMYAQLAFIQFGMHLFAAFVLTYTAIKYIRSKQVESIDDAPELTAPIDQFKQSLNQALAMPMRLPVAMAILLASGVYINHPPQWQELPKIYTGILIGSTWWWAQFTFLSLYFVKRVPLPITIKSLNKIRPLCTAICLCLAIIALLITD
jgi:threonine/homoserine/homoserine lactone efflux protein